MSRKGECRERVLVRHGPLFPIRHLKQFDCHCGIGGIGGLKRNDAGDAAFGLGLGANADRTPMLRTSTLHDYPQFPQYRLDPLELFR